MGDVLLVRYAHGPGGEGVHPGQGSPVKEAEGLGGWEGGSLLAPDR